MISESFLNTLICQSSAITLLRKVPYTAPTDSPSILP
jgi:hypothetical protein